MDSPLLIARIEDADLPATTYRTARRLLDMASADGHVTLAKVDMLTISGTDKWATVRSHLGQLTRAGLIHYSTNAMVYVNFVIAERAQMTSERSSVTSERAQPDDPTRAERAQMTSERAQPDPTRAQRSSVTSERAQEPSERSNEPSLGRLGKVGRLGTDQEPTYLPTLDDLTDEQRRAVALLTDPDVGLVEASAIEHATGHSWTHILRMVANWYTDVQEHKISGPGALHTRLQRNWTVGPITADFRRSELCARHAPEETFEAVENGSRQRYRVTSFRLSEFD